ncbi:hypothetical protein [Metabacillus sp. Hm71]|uniref:hypothetical protein n=1 Tax=Metabacillus sp. Hm71 TaxID=3450743 RepID=UPI003F443CCA
MMETHFKNNMYQLRDIIKKLNLDFTNDTEDKLVWELYRHIEYTSRKSYGKGYDQGKFDKEMELSYKQRSNDASSDIIGELILEILD